MKPTDQQVWDAFDRWHDREGDSSMSPDAMFRYGWACCMESSYGTVNPNFKLENMNRAGSPAKLASKEKNTEDVS